MELLKVNETPLRTTRNYNINNFKLANVVIPTTINKFKNVIIEGAESNKIQYLDKITEDNFDFKYGVGDILVSKAKNESNCEVNLEILSKINKDVKVIFDLDNNNKNLLENISINAKEDTKATIYIVYKENENLESFHNGLIKIKAENNSNINIIVLNLLSLKSDNFISIESNIFDGAKVNMTVIDFGGNNSISNIYFNLLGKESYMDLNSIYIGSLKNKIDMNYIAELKGEKSVALINVEGALKDNAKKHFKGTIDFKSGCKKAKGDENEFCTLLSDNAKSIALPMLLCSEDEVEGNHSSAAGKVGEKELFYIMSRGFDYKAAMKLLIRARFNKVIDNIRDESIKNLVIYEMEKRLD